MEHHETATEQAEAAVAPETGRDRVRRLLLQPLGFRSPRGVSPEDERRFLDGLADELGYMADDSLRALRDMMQPRGQGSARCFWPDRASFLGFAHIVEPRPISQLPALRRWFGSVEGPRAREDGTLVETFDYFARHSAPPVTEGARRAVADAAERNARRLKIVEEKTAAGAVVPPDDREWARAYRARRAYVDELVKIERERREARA